MAKLISKTYGDALFELAIEEDKIDALQEEVAGLLEILKAEPEFDRLMDHPQITKEEKIQLVETVFGKNVSDTLYGFLKLVVLKDRYDQIGDILKYFLDRVKSQKGIGTVYVTTPMVLRKEQEEAVKARILETTEYQALEMHYDVDPELIGGIKIRIGDRVMDNSVKTQLDTLQKQLLKVQV